MVSSGYNGTDINHNDSKNWLAVTPHISICLDLDISTPPTILHTVVDMPQIFLSKGELVNKSNTIGGTMSKVFLKWLPCFVFNANKMDNKSSESPLKCDEK